MPHNIGVKGVSGSLGNYSGPMAGVMPGWHEIEFVIVALKLEIHWN